MPQYQSTTPVIGFVDIDSFECQLWQNDFPECRGEPCVVTNQSGRILSVTNEAKLLGVSRSATPFIKDAQEVCPSLHQFKKPNVYGKPDSKKTRRGTWLVLRCIQEYCKRFGKDIVIELASSDEFYLDISSEITRRMEKKLNSRKEGNISVRLPDNIVLERCDGKKRAGPFYYQLQRNIPETVANHCNLKHLQQEEDRLALGSIFMSGLCAKLLEKTKLSSSAGVGTNKLLAKLGCGINKPGKVTIFHKMALQKMSEAIAIKNIPGLGGQIGERLMASFNINLVSELRRLHLSELEEHFGPEYQDLAKKIFSWARGDDSQPVMQKYMYDRLVCNKPCADVETVKRLEQIIGNLSREVLHRLEEEKKRHKRFTNNIRFGFTVESQDGVKESQNLYINVDLTTDASKLSEESLKFIREQPIFLGESEAMDPSISPANVCDAIAELDQSNQQSINLAEPEPTGDAYIQAPTMLPETSDFDQCVSQSTCPDQSLENTQSQEPRIHDETRDVDQFIQNLISIAERIYEHHIEKPTTRAETPVLDPPTQNPSCLAEFDDNTPIEKPTKIMLLETMALDQHIQNTTLVPEQVLDACIEKPTMYPETLNLDQSVQKLVSIPELFRNAVVEKSTMLTETADLDKPLDTSTCLAETTETLNIETPQILSIPSDPSKPIQTAICLAEPLEDLCIPKPTQIHAETLTFNLDQSVQKSISVAESEPAENSHIGKLMAHLETENCNSLIQKRNNLAINQLKFKITQLKFAVNEFISMNTGNDKDKAEDLNKALKLKPKHFLPVNSKPDTAPAFTSRKHIGTFSSTSTKENRKGKRTSSNMDLPKLIPVKSLLRLKGSNLEDGFDATKPQFDNSKHIELKHLSFLNWLQTSKFMDKVKAGEFKKPDFIGFSGRFAEAMRSPTVKQFHNWEVYGANVGEIIYLWDEPRPRQERAHTRHTYHGTRFEWLTVEKNKDSDGADDYEMAYIVNEVTLDQHQLLVVSNVDAVDANGNWTEISTWRTSHANALFAKMLRTWSQCSVDGIQQLVLGSRNDRGILKKVEIKSLEDMASFLGDSVTSKCLNFQNKFLSYVKAHLPESNRNVVKKFTYTCSNDCVFCEEVQQTGIKNLLLSRLYSGYFNQQAKLNKTPRTTKED